MATPATVNPFNHYVGLDGMPLENGYIWFGEPFQDPELVPLAAYWDDANTQPAAQPIRTTAGYPARNGAPAMVFVGAQYSMRVRDRNGRQVFYAPNVTAVDLGGGGLDVITASGGQTIVTLVNAAYTPGANALDVYLNGIRLVSGQDYFETGTNQVTMAAALSAGDQVIAFARSTFGLTQAVLSDWQAQVFNGAGGGSQNFVLTRSPGAIANLDVSVTIGGIGSTLRPLIDYTLSGNTVTITPAPAVGTNNVLIRYGRSLPQDALRGELASTASAADGAGLVKFNPSLNYTLQTLGWVNKQGAINVAWFTGADNTGATDNTAIFAAAAAIGGHAIYVPTGTWAINWRTTNKIIIVGDGSNSTFIKPFNSATAAITYAASSPYWTYHSQVRDLCFLGAAGVGVGFTFGQTVFASYTSGDEYMNNVTFSCVRFKLLEKGVLCPYGNIGKQFYNCSFSECTYGIYSIDAKFGGLMHAGNLYVYGGEMSRCQCAVYIHNVTDGFGGVVFDGVIFEYNSISTYINTNNTFTPVEFRNCWNEQNGVISGTGSPVSLDQWSGSTRTTTNFTARAHIFDGSNSRYTYTGGRVSDFYLKATNTEVVCIKARAERTAGVGGANCTVDDANSQIRMIDPMTDKGAPFGRGMITEGAQRIVSGYTIDSNSGSASSRWMQVPHRYHKATSYGDLASSAVLPLTGSTNLDAGSFAAIPGSVVSDGIIYGSCNQWTVPFTTTSQFMQLTGSSITTTAGWYVCTIDLKITSGSCLFYLWDRSTVQMAAGADLQSGEWVTLAAMAYSPGSQSFYFDVRGNAVSVTFRASAFQLKHFATQIDAEQFLKSMVYIAS